MNVPDLIRLRGIPTHARYSIYAVDTVYNKQLFDGNKKYYVIFIHIRLDIFYSILSKISFELVIMRPVKYILNM